MRKLRLSRRTVLKGIGGAVVGLPLLDCMLNEHGTALAQSGGALPKRYAIVFAGQALGGDDYAEDTSRVNGQNMTQTGQHIPPLQSGAG